MAAVLEVFCEVLNLVMYF